MIVKLLRQFAHISTSGTVQRKLSRAQIFANHQQTCQKKKFRDFYFRDKVTISDQTPTISRMEMVTLSVYFDAISYTNIYSYPSRPVLCLVVCPTKFQQYKLHILIEHGITAVCLHHSNVSIVGNSGEDGRVVSCRHRMYGFTHSCQVFTYQFRYMIQQQGTGESHKQSSLSVVVGALHQISGDLYTVRDLLYDIHIVVT